MITALDNSTVNNQEINEAISKPQYQIEINPKNPPTVHEFRKAGYIVRIDHFRYLWNPETKVVDEMSFRHTDDVLDRKTIAPHGGETHVYIQAPDGTAYNEIARCRLFDSYNKKIGVRICLGRICKQIVEDSSLPF